MKKSITSIISIKDMLDDVYMKGFIRVRYRKIYTFQSIKKNSISDCTSDVIKAVQNYDSLKTVVAK